MTAPTPKIAALEAEAERITTLKEIKDWYSRYESACLEHRVELERESEKEQEHESQVRYP